MFALAIRQTKRPTALVGTVSAGECKDFEERMENANRKEKNREENDVIIKQTTFPINS